jgi:hypothetical protein
MKYADPALETRRKAELARIQRASKPIAGDSISGFSGSLELDDPASRLPGLGGSGGFSGQAALTTAGGLPEGHGGAALSSDGFSVSSGRVGLISGNGATSHQGAYNPPKLPENDLQEDIQPTTKNTTTTKTPSEEVSNHPIVSMIAFNQMIDDKLRGREPVPQIDFPEWDDLIDRHAWKRAVNEWKAAGFDGKPLRE